MEGRSTPVVSTISPAYGAGRNLFSKKVINNTSRFVAAEWGILYIGGDKQQYKSNGIKPNAAETLNGQTEQKIYKFNIFRLFGDLEGSGLLVFGYNIK